MSSLIEEIQTPKSSLQSFHDTTVRVLEYIPAVISQRTEFRDYIICSAEAAGTVKHLRPIRSGLFIFDSKEFSYNFDSFMQIMTSIKKREKDIIKSDAHKIINSTTYTIQQSIGVALDLLANPNSARKHVGNRFEELIQLIISGLNIANKKITFQIPYKISGGTRRYSCQIDLIISPFPEVVSTIKNINDREIVISAKTTSKDRMGKIFLDKMLLQKFVRHDVKVVGIFLNDVQRAQPKRKKASQKISFTLVSGLFMVYTEFLMKLDGVYFIDPPPNALVSPLNRHIFRFSKFIIEDIWNMVS
jgi:hypothetical protein